MIAHSAAWCQCNSLMPPAVKRMLTPVIVFEIAKSACVTWRAQPPFWMRFGALLKDAQSIGMPPTSVAGGGFADGKSLSLGPPFRARDLRFSPAFAVFAP